MKELLQELIDKIECEDVKKVFLALGSNSVFLNALNEADPEFKKKLDEMSKGMNVAGMDEMEILKEIGPDISVPDLANYIANAIKNDDDFFAEKAGFAMADVASEEVSEFLLNK